MIDSAIPERIQNQKEKKRRYRIKRIKCLIIIKCLIKVLLFSLDYKQVFFKIQKKILFSHTEVFRIAFQKSR